MVELHQDEGLDKLCLDQRSLDNHYRLVRKDRVSFRYGPYVAAELEIQQEIKKIFSENPPNIYGFGHTPLYADVIEAIKTGRPPLVDARAGKRALELVLAIYKSAAEHRPVKLPLKECSSMDFAGRFDN